MRRKRLVPIPGVRGEVNMSEHKVTMEGFEDMEFETYSDPSAVKSGDIHTQEHDERPATKKSPPSSSPSSPSSSWLSFLSVEYYQGLFDVTTSQVLGRVMAGMIPYPCKLSSSLSQSPDLYGPFWLCMTLVFTVALSGNIAELLSGSNQWEFHFHEVIVLATVVYGYTWLVPFLLWLLTIWCSTTNRHSLLELLAIYGYSMAVFVPLTVCWVVNIEAVRWLCLVVAMLLSGTVLVQALWQSFCNDNRKIVLVVLAAVLLLHFSIAIGFKYYYFGSSLAPVPIINDDAPIVHYAPMHNSTTASIAPTNTTNNTL